VTQGGIVLISTVSTLAVGLRALAAWRGKSQALPSQRLAFMGAWARPAAEEVHALKRRLISAGLREPEALDQFIAARVLSVVFAACIGLLFGRWTVGFFIAIGSGIAGAFLGWALPGRVLDWRAQARRKAIARALPGAVDLIVICMDAGLSLERSVSRVAEEMGQYDEILSDELGVVARELEAGVAVAESLRKLSQRVRLEELESLCAVLGHASILGARVSHVLRDHSTALRRRRMAELDERAGKVGATLTLPLALCLLPASLLVMLGPAILIVLGSLKG
jgi:tight adherence protein C